MGINIPAQREALYVKSRLFSGFDASGMPLAMGPPEKRITMKRFPTLLSLSLLCLTQVALASRNAEEDERTVILRIENVGPEALGLSADPANGPFVRVVAKASNGKYLVAVQSNIGIIRMQGAYLDSNLTVEDGIFTYYHPNGRLECKGCYAGGIKTGTWIRYGLDGTRLSERVYTGRSVEELVQQIAHAPAARAAQPADPRFVTAKHRSSIEF